MSQNVLLDILLDCATEASLPGDPALHVAVRSRSSGAVRVLLAAGADVNQPAHDGRTSLHIACSLDLLPLVKILCEHKADVNARSVAGMSPLHEAKSGDVVKMLCSYGADCDARENNNETPLHSVCSIDVYDSKMICFGYAPNKAVSALISVGCDINAETEGKTALELLSQKTSLRPVDRLLDNDVFDIMEPEFQEAAIYIKKHAMKLKALGLHVNQKNLDFFPSTNSLLADFAEACSEELARLKDKYIEGSVYTVC